MKDTVISDGQSLLDVAIQETGTLESLFDIAKANGWDNITPDLVAGQVVKIDTATQNKETVNYFTERNLRLNTGSSILTISERVFDESFDETFN